MPKFKTGSARASAILFLCLSGYAATWKIEVVDPGGGGKYSDLLIDKFGNAHASYVNEALHQLKYTFWDQRLNKWFTMDVDNQCAGFASMTLDSQQRPRIAYLEYGTGRLKYAYWSDLAWHLQRIDLNITSVEYYTSITLDSEDRPIISYYDVVGPDKYAEYVLNVRVVRFTGNAWETMTIDATPGSGKFNSIASIAGKDLQIAYANVRSETASLRYARWNGNSWNVKILEGATHPQGIYSVKLVLDKQGNPHIAYTDTVNHHVKYATTRDGKWHIQVVDALANEAYPDRNGIALDDKGTPYLSYYDSRQGVLKVAHPEGEKWVSEEVDANFAGFTSSIQIVNGEIMLVYYDTITNSLKCARRPWAPTNADNHEVARAMSLPWWTSSGFFGTVQAGTAEREWRRPS